jgi:hypothetical protein
LIWEKGQVPWNKGLVGVYSEETLEKMRKPKSEEAKQNMRKPKSVKGHIPWNKGSTGTKRSEEFCKKMSELAKIREQKKKEDGFTVKQETKDKISKKLKGRKIPKEKQRKNYKPTQETKDKTSKTLMGHSVSEETIEKMKNREYSEETRKKMSEKQKGRKHTEEHNLKIGKALKGRKQTAEHTRKVREANIGNPKLSGTNSPWYIDGKGEYPYPKDFTNIRNSILKRDNHTCQHCEAKAIEVHHIDRDKTNNDPMNLVSVCKSSHTLAHIPKQRSYWKLYYEELMSLRFSNIKQEKEIHL